MARPLRYNPPGSIHHVTRRGNERRDIVRSDRDRRKFVVKLAEVVLEREWILPVAFLWRSGGGGITE